MGKVYVITFRTNNGTLIRDLRSNNKVWSKQSWIADGDNKLFVTEIKTTNWFYAKIAPLMWKFTNWVYNVAGKTADVWE